MSHFMGDRAGRVSCTTGEYIEPTKWFPGVLLDILEEIPNFILAIPGLAAGVIGIFLDRERGPFFKCLRFMRRKALCYGKRRLKAIWGDDYSFDLAMRLGHDYILDLPRAAQSIEMRHIKARTAMLEDAGLTDAAMREHWYDLALGDGLRHCDMMIRRWEGLHSGRDGICDRRFVDLDFREREEWWRIELGKLAENARGVWEGKEPTEFLASVPPAGYDCAYAYSEERRKRIEEKKLAEKYAQFRPGEYGLMIAVTKDKGFSSGMHPDAFRRILDRLRGGEKRELSYAAAMRRIRRRKAASARKAAKPFIILKNPARSRADRERQAIMRIREKVLSRDFRKCAAENGLFGTITGDVDIPDLELARRIAAGTPGYDILGDNYEERIGAEYALAAYGLPGLLATRYPEAFDRCGKVAEDLMPAMLCNRGYLRSYADEYGDLSRHCMRYRYAGFKHKLELKKAYKAVSRFCVRIDTGLFSDPEYLRETTRRQLIYMGKDPAETVLDSLSDSEIVERLSEHARPKRCELGFSARLHSGLRIKRSARDGRSVPPPV